MSGARTSLTGSLARMGFADVTRAERQLADVGITSEDHPLLAALAQAADPGLALAGLARITERDATLPKALGDDSAFRYRLTAVLGVSKAVADHLVRHPDDCAVLRGPDATAVQIQRRSGKSCSSPSPPTRTTQNPGPAWTPGKPTRRPGSPPPTGAASCTSPPAI